MLIRHYGESCIIKGSSFSFPFPDDVGLRDDDASLVCFLAHRASSVGPAAMARDISAFRFGHGSSASPEQSLADLMSSGVKRATQPIQQPSATQEDIKRVLTWMAGSHELKDIRATLAVCLSWTALLRCGEAANLTWDDLRLSGDVLEVKVRI